MKVNLFIEMDASFDSKELYELIKVYDANLLDDGIKVYIYIETYIKTATDIVYHASLFGNTTVYITHLKEGLDNGKKEE